ncbi:MAG: SAM-dependent methyltransferase [Marinilabiliales bacterium]|nr:MAG: SAM-dependent methyltransferase [Marinilabiliales bacterium]
MIDPFGFAVSDYLSGIRGTAIMVYSNLTEPDIISVDYLFRSYKEMPELEQIALKECSGLILDVGACAGAHMLELQQQGKETEGIDTSEKIVTLLKQRNLIAYHADFYRYDISRYDTILLLMNGLGIAGTVNGLHKMMQKFSDNMKEGAQVLADSSDIAYMFDDEQSMKDWSTEVEYYGELKYQIEYKDVLGAEFNWLFADFNLIRDIAEKYQLKAELLFEDQNNQFLCRIIRE